MRRSVINRAYREALACWTQHHWALPPEPRWDITDFGLGDFDRCGLVLVNLATEPEYCEKLMYARRDQATPCHMHAQKKEDIICRSGELVVQVWPTRPDLSAATVGGTKVFSVNVNGVPQQVSAGASLRLIAGSRVTLVPGTWHSFFPSSSECILGEVSTANDDLHDNFFVDPRIGRFSSTEEDEPALIRLVSE